MECTTDLAKNLNFTHNARLLHLEKLSIMIVSQPGS